MGRCPLHTAKLVRCVRKLSSEDPKIFWSSTTINLYDSRQADFENNFLFGKIWAECIGFAEITDTFAVAKTMIYNWNRHCKFDQKSGKYFSSGGINNMLWLPLTGWRSVLTCSRRGSVFLTRVLAWWTKFRESSGQHLYWWTLICTLCGYCIRQYAEVNLNHAFPAKRAGTHSVICSGQKEKVFTCWHE